MGQCFSCNESSHPSQNGHTPYQTTARPDVTSIQISHHTNVAKQPSINVGSGKINTFQAATTTQDSDSDRRIFAQHSKLAPVRKSSTGDGKRLSLTSKEYSDTRINSLYDHYRDIETDLITEEGIVKLCSDLEVKPDDFRVLVLAWKFQAETMCRFTRKEFTNGCKGLKVDSIKAIQSKFPEMLDEVKREPIFKEFYRWTFRFALDSDVGQRSLPLEIGRDLWRLVFHQHDDKLLDRWIYFLDEHPCICAISKDTWHMFLNFLQSVNDDLCSYDDTAAWPSLFDDFVQYERDRLNQNIQPNKEHASESTSTSSVPH